LLSELKKTPTAGEKRKEIFMVQQSYTGIKRDADHVEPWMSQEITFPPIRGGNFANSPLTISAVIAGHLVHRMYVDSGSAAEIMYEHCFAQLDEKTRRALNPEAHPLVGFSGEVVQPLGQIQLPVIMGDAIGQRQVIMNFLIIRSPSSHNVILGRPGLCALGAVVSTVHSMIQFPTPNGVVTLQSNQECQTVRAIPDTMTNSPTYST
jgi:hypothetical protein